ncbi:site-specific integrase [Gaetbulibacter aestuarii]|uniref:Phage integrase SAM-like domain-containing protein n=1 Tax=Gaetbulibacter aestuarii TaxID=1502358 RepID=A0ABW7N163_9FLAO
MLKIIYFIKTDRVTKKGECPIYAKISYRGKSITMSTGKFITNERWQFTHHLRGSLKITKEKVMKASLDSLSTLFETKFNLLLKNNSPIDLKAIKDDILGKEKKVTRSKKGIIEIFDIHNAHFEKKVQYGERSAASLQKYNRAKDLVQAFLRKKYKLDTINVDKITSAFIYNLESFMKYESVYKGKVGIKNNSVVKYFTTIQTVCNYGIKLDLIDKNPFTKYDGKIVKKDAVFLTPRELKAIEDKVFKMDRLEKVKDIFLFSCYTGYAPVDAESLTPDNLIKNSQGDLWIIANRAKTGTRANVPVLPPTEKIIHKYWGQQPTLLPKISNQKMNAYLKEIADLCGIKKKLTWYVARHTFATTVTLGNGVKIENVSAMMGHTNIKQTQHYAKVLDSNVMDDMQRLKSIFS